MGSRLHCPNKRTLDKLPELLLRRLYQELDWADGQIADYVGLKRETVARLRKLYGIPTTPKINQIRAWHKGRSEEQVRRARRKCWETRRRNRTDKTGRVPRSAFKPGNDNGRRGKTPEDLFGAEGGRAFREKIAASLKGRAAGTNNPMFGKPPLNRKNNHKGGYVNSPLQDIVWMRSSWEIEYANYLTTQGIQWLYEPRCFDLGNGRTYRPDFYLPDSDQWIEIKGYLTELDRQKVALMASIYGITIHIISWDEMKALGLRTRPERISSSRARAS